VSVPDELYQKAVEIAEAQHVSVDEVFASARSWNNSLPGNA
jgi:hypothetical protein